MSSSSAAKHLPRLDSVRGIAALMVAGFHGLALHGSIGAVALGFFFDSRVGVSMFFVLSGLVLGMSLRRSGDLSWKVFWKFYVRRFFRLYPAFFVCLLPYLALYFFLKYRHQLGLPVGEGWHNHFLDDSFTTWKLIKNFLFLDQGLNGVTWTLKVEAQAALLFPLFHWYSCRFPWKAQLGLLLALFGLTVLAESSTRFNLSLFYCGYLLPTALEKFREFTVRREHLSQLVLLTGALALFAASHLFPGEGLDRRLSVILAGLGSALLLGLLLTHPEMGIFRVLDIPAVRYLGTISYSFYLLNLFCLDLTQRLYFYFPIPFLTQQPFLQSVVVFLEAFIFCVMLASLSFYLVERPFIKWGSRFYRD